MRTGSGGRRKRSVKPSNQRKEVSDDEEVEDDCEDRRGGAYGLVRRAGLSSRHRGTVVTVATCSGRDERIVPPFSLFTR